MGNTAGFTLLWVGETGVLFAFYEDLSAGEWVTTGDRSEDRRVSKLLK